MAEEEAEAWAEGEKGECVAFGANHVQAMVPRPEESSSSDSLKLFREASELPPALPSGLCLLVKGNLAWLCKAHK